MNGTPNPILVELNGLDAELAARLPQRDSAAWLRDNLPRRWRPSAIGSPGPPQRAWELCGLYYLNSQPRRCHEALAVFWRLYQQMLVAQVRLGRVHKGMPLVWMSDCFGSLGFPVHAKRYLMLTLCEDALREAGRVTPETTGVYFRLVWGHGLRDSEFRRYATEFWQQRRASPETQLFPEALLQRVDDRWLTEMPAPAETPIYLANDSYVKRLLRQLGDGAGQTLEILAEYLLSCMPGCRTKRRAHSGSTDYDIVCAMEGPDLDFRSELGRYFVCECKDWAKPADFTTMAKFCRVLDSTKARFGILFSRSGLSGQGRTAFAEREQLKVFQDRGIVIVVLDRHDLDAVAGGVNLISLLRERYESVRLDLKGVATLASDQMQRTRSATARRRGPRR
jgi:hypothetical protein